MEDFERLYAWATRPQARPWRLRFYWWWYSDARYLLQLGLIGGAATGLLLVVMQRGQAC